MEDQGRGSVLVVDDEPTIAEVVSRYLERAGYRTRVAADGAQALELVARQRPDLIVLDLMLPGIDGLEVMRRLRQPERERIGLILLTAKGEESSSRSHRRNWSPASTPCCAGSTRRRPRRPRSSSAT
jgi:CheY-like chemotaxis protein